jgi:hypothetical protein
MTNRNEREDDEPTPDEQGEQPFDARSADGGSMGGGASGPRAMPAGGDGAQGDESDGYGAGRRGEQGQEAPDQGQAPVERDREQIESYGSRDDDSDALLSPSSQIGRAQQTGGTPESRRDPDVRTREGWPAPEQDDTPENWPDPKSD